MADYDSDLLSTPVYHAELYRRPVNKKDKKNIPFASVYHYAVKLHTHQGSMLVEKGPGVGPTKDVSISIDEVLGDEWVKMKESSVSGKTVGDFYRSAKPELPYNLASENCQHAASRMWKNTDDGSSWWSCIIM